MADAISIHLACNDDGGNFAGELYRAEFHEPGGDVLATLEYDPLAGLPLSWREGLDESVLTIDGETFRVGERKRWVGNLCWDATVASKAQAVRLARHLVRRGFDVTSHVCEGPWDALEASDG